jgi:uncharacterized protein YjbJ (UPF0337 family)
LTEKFASKLKKTITFGKVEGQGKMENAEGDRQQAEGNIKNRSRKT